MLVFCAILGKAHIHELFLGYRVVTGLNCLVYHKTMAINTAQQTPHWKGIVSSEK